MSKLRFLPRQLILLVAILFVADQVYASEETLADFWRDSTFSGDLRTYYFTRNYGNESAPPNQTAFAMGGMLQYLSPSFFDGFRVGAAYYLSSPLGLGSDERERVDTTLPGDKAVSVLGQAYLQYQNTWALLRAGNILIQTPWLNEDDTRMVPATYQGIIGIFNPFKTKDFSVTALRTFKFKGRTANSFDDLNLYNFALSKFTATNKGALAVGGRYNPDNLNAQVWFYQFYDIARLFYVDVTRTFKTDYGFDPIIGGQYVRERGDGDNLLAPIGGGAANADAYGLLAGVKVGNASFTLGYNWMPIRTGAYGQGNLISPYTGSDPLYTSSMIISIFNEGPGSAIKAKVTYQALEKKLLLAASFAKYYTQPVIADTTETDFDVKYILSGICKGLSIRDRIGVLQGNSTLGRFIYNRVMLQLDF